jgi:carboxypeptidase PM20D1
MKKTLVRLGAVLVLLVLALVAVVLARTAGFASRQPQVTPAPPVALDEAALVDRFARSLRFRTVSHAEGPEASAAEFERFHEFLAASFPRVHATLARETVAGLSLLYTWPGSDPVAPPVLLMAHLDVVPVEPGTEALWTYPAFEGRVADGYVWGRGALDNKFGVMGIFEAVERLLEEGHRPRRTVYLAFGHDEEVGGQGAQATAALLASRGVALEWVLDEGGVISEGIVPGVDAPVALVGVAEKGYVSLELSARGVGGHSSMPPRETAVGIVSRAVHRLERDPFPGRLQGAANEMFAWLGPELPFAQRMAFANLWLFRPLVERQLAASPNTDAALRTTTAATMFEGSVKDNVLPIHARAVVNFRILPGETTETVRERVRRVVDDPRVEIGVHGGFGNDPSPVSSTEAPAFGVLARTVREVFPDALVAPYLVLGATDSRHYAGLTASVHRFMPARITERELAGMHGTDERVAVRSYLEGVRFYRQLILNADG